jgi:hypothetical protein
MAIETVTNLSYPIFSFSKVLIHKSRESFAELELASLEKKFIWLLFSFGTQEMVISLPL